MSLNHQAKDNDANQLLEAQIHQHLALEQQFKNQLQLHPRQPPSLEHEPKFDVKPIESYLPSTSLHDYEDKAVGPIVSHSNLPLCYANNMLMCSTTVIGSRPEQQDRYVMAPSLLGGDLSLFAVFDGTTGDYAAEWLREHCIDVLLTLEPYLTLGNLLSENKKNPILTQPILTNLLQTLYSTLDSQLLQWCAHQSATHELDEAFKYDYTASTGVITLIHHPSAQLCVSHVADSHAVIAAPQPIRPESQQQQQQHNLATGVRPHISFSLTKSHKPDEREELMRINAAGGQLVYLHDQKPFIRGKDFRTKRKAIQLNYSRAFGSKDLKHSGLISIPDITIIPLRNAPCNALAIKLQGKGVDGKEISLGPEHINTTTKSTNGVSSIPNAEEAPSHGGEDAGKGANGTNGTNDNLVPVSITVDQYAINSPSVPITNIGMTIGGNAMLKSSPKPSSIWDNESDEDQSPTSSPQQATMTLEQLALRQNQSPDVDNNASLQNNGDGVENGPNGGPNEDKSEYLRNFQKIFAESDSIRTSFPFPSYQTLSSFHDVNRLQHSPALRMVQGIVDVRALVIGSDGVFDVLSPSQTIDSAYLQLSRCLQQGCHEAPSMQHIPPGQLQDFIQKHHDFLLKMRNRGAISIYPDFVAHSQWMQDPNWNYSPSDAVASQALLQHELRRSGDNVTCLVVFF